MDMQNWPKSDWENVYYGLKEISRKMEQVMFDCGNDEKAKRFAQDCVDGIDTWLENCKRKGHIEEGTVDLTSSKKPVKSAMDNTAWYHQEPKRLGKWQVVYMEDGKEKYQFNLNSKEECIDWINDNGFTLDTSMIESAMPGREKSIRAIMDEYGCSWEEAEEIMNEQVSSSCKSLKSAMPGKEKYIQAVMDEYGCSREEAEEIIADEIQSSRKVLKNEKLWPGFDKNGEVYFYDHDEYVETFGEEPDDKDAIDDIESGCHGKSKKEKKEQKKPEKIEQTRRARNTESLNNLYGKMF